MKVWLNIHNHRKGGSLVCDDETAEYDDLPPVSKIKEKLAQHMKKHNTDHALFRLQGCVKKGE